VVEVEAEALEKGTLTLKRWAVLRPESVVYTLHILMFVKRKSGPESVIGIAMSWTLRGSGSILPLAVRSKA